jgi:outer membrane protein
MRQCLAIFLCGAMVGFGQQAAPLPAPEHVLERLEPVIQPEPLFLTPAYVKRRFFTPSTVVNIAVPRGLRQFVVDGKLRLGLKDFLGLTLDNNYDITVQQVNVQISENAVTRAFAVFDPTLATSFSDTRQKSASSSALAGASTLNQLTQSYNLGLTQFTPTGGTYTASYGQTRLSNNSTFSLLNPSLSAGLGLSITQPLLRNRGPYIAKLPITLARSRLTTARSNLENQVLQLIVFAEQAYWNVIQARENLRVQRETLKLADAALTRSKRELELGAISSLEIYQPEANFANAQISVTQAGYQLSQAEDAARRQIGADLDPDIALLPLDLVEPIDVPQGEPLNKAAAVSYALKKRQDLQTFALGLATDDLQIRQVTENLRPDLSVGLGYSASGIGGTFINNGVPIPGGAFDSLSQLFGFSFPTYSASVTLRLPLRDRRTSADLADALVNKKIDTLRVRSQEQNVRLQVLNAIDQVENSKASVQLARVALDLAQKRVDADQKRYELGTTTIFFVLASQNDLAVAAGVLVREQVNYRRNLLQLYQSTGQLLDERGIAVR